jgi:CheY-like chemotaxis protein
MFAGDRKIVVLEADLETLSVKLRNYSYPEIPLMKKRILLVDDDASVRESVKQALQWENYEVLSAANGKEALETFFEGYIDLVLLDLAMPVKNGWDTLERMTAYNPYLPIIIITAKPDQSESAVAAGATALMEKPLDLLLLLGTINCLLEESVEERLSRIYAHRPFLISPPT